MRFEHRKYNCSTVKLLKTNYNRKYDFKWREIRNLKCNNLPFRVMENIPIRFDIFLEDPHCNR